MLFIGADIKKGCGGSDGVQGKGREYGVKNMTGVDIV